MILKLLLGTQEVDANIFNGSEKIRNVAKLLPKIPRNDYLRISDNLDSVMSFLSETSNNMLRDFLNKHKNEQYQCPNCKKILNPDDDKWICDKCLLWYHKTCASPQYFGPSGDKNNIRFCMKCFFFIVLKCMPYACYYYIINISRMISN